MIAWDSGRFGSNWMSARVTGNGLWINRPVQTFRHEDGFASGPSGVRVRRDGKPALFVEADGIRSNMGRQTPTSISNSELLRQ